MNFQTLEPYLLPSIIIIFFGFRFYRFKKIKKMIPALLKEGALIIDVRSSSEFLSAHNPGSTNIPLEKINSESKKLDNSKTIILCCASGTRSGIAVGVLKKNGLKKVLNAGPWTNTITS